MRVAETLETFRLTMTTKIKTVVQKNEAELLLLPPPPPQISLQVLMEAGMEDIVMHLRFGAIDATKSMSPITMTTMTLIQMIQMTLIQMIQMVLKKQYGLK